MEKGYKGRPKKVFRWDYGREESFQSGKRKKCQIWVSEDPTERQNGTSEWFEGQLGPLRELQESLSETVPIL